MPKSKQSKNFYFRSFTLPLAILLKLKAGKYEKQIANEIGISKQRVHYYITIFLSKGYITTLFKSSCKCYDLTTEGHKLLSELQKEKLQSKKSSPGMKQFLLMPKKTRLHALTIKFPIIEDKDNRKWNKEVKINNWVKRYEVLPIGITVEKTTKHIIAHFHSIETEKPLFMTEFQNQAFRGLLYLISWLRHRNILIDGFSGEVISQHIANESDEYEKAVDKHLTVSKELGRTAQSLFPTKINAKAWIDRSEGQLETETNDTIYEEKLLKMPETIDDMEKKMIPVLNSFSHQIMLHLEVQKETLKTLKKIQDSL